MERGRDVGIGIGISNGLDGKDRLHSASEYEGGADSCGVNQ